MSLGSFTLRSTDCRMELCCSDFLISTRRGRWLHSVDPTAAVIQSGASLFITLIIIHQYAASVLFYISNNCSMFFIVFVVLSRRMFL
ncbi:L-lysine 23-aminomutase [Dissostichus eleginoides]|uniref:L-lysine 23-aminomutase n=1 Tax=Dissostichus eleginoides TaxID=100907 RepID=A0AAD9CA29_DISEL|nr:L-lysine 23-aminomutase [Dissostichus eleginoides]